MIVADTNVITYLALPSPYTPQAEQLLLRESEWVAPALWRSEFRNVLALYIRKSLVSFEEALAVQAEMEDLLSGNEYEVTSLDVLSLVNKSSCSAYDCEFVALAASLRAPMVTMDKRLASAFPETVVLLTEYANDPTAEVGEPDRTR
ncbi:PIN domain-containing protein [Microbulbifer rhizosphaerae]|uniref:Putative nucleic acid-binding protein n=1 Tax=Microbulbifer rhizosphaerae TaxID=1562603 RepID=A0A7W4WCZ2_9GAMM|nr:putative nucleic acid-binding protein [Microbulbifer rhizosphaerae]